MVSLLIIIVLYKKKLADSVSFNSLRGALKQKNLNLSYFIYDNSPECDTSIDFDTPSLFYFHDSSNSGLSIAFNKGSQFASMKGFEWIMLADDDTQFSENLFFEFMQTSETKLDINLFVPILKLTDGKIFSPCRYKHKRGYPLKSIQHGVYKLNRYFPVNSGMIIRLKEFIKSGAYNEKLKVDFCDFQFLEKFRVLHNDFYVLNSFAYQNFSNTEKSIHKQIERFKVFLEDARNCEKPGLKDKVEFLYVVARHSLALSIRFYDLSFLIHFAKYYFKTLKQHDKGLNF